MPDAFLGGVGLSAFEVPHEAVWAAAEAVNAKRWRGGPRWAAHAGHRFDGGCAVCQGDVEAIAAVAVEAAGPLIAERIARLIESGCPAPDEPHTVPCDYQDAARIAREALGGEGGLDGAGLVVTGVCACGQPLGTCPGCGDSRCWRCDPESDGCHAETAPAHARVEAARRMLDAVREELGRERVEHGAVVAVLAGARALANEWAAAGEDPVEPSDTVVAECGQELLARLGSGEEDWFQRLCAAVEAVLMDHQDELDDEHGKVDANLADLAHLYRELTGFDAKEEIAKDAP